MVWGPSAGTAGSFKPSWRPGDSKVGPIVPAGSPSMNQTKADSRVVLLSLSSTTVGVNSRFGVGADALPVVGPDTVTTGGVLVGVGGGVGDGDEVEGVGSGVLVAEAAGSLITTASRPATAENISTT